MVAILGLTLFRVFKDMGCKAKGVLIMFTSINKPEGSVEDKNGNEHYLEKVETSF